MIMIIGRSKPQILSMLFRVLFSYPNGGLEQFWTSFPALCRSLFLINNGFLHVNRGCGVAEGVIAKSQLQKTKDTEPECISETIRKHC